MAAADLSLVDSLIERRFRLPDPLWERIRPLLPRHRPSPLGGRPRADDRRCMEAILYVLLTGVQWRALPRCYGPATTAHDRFQEWTRARIFERLWRRALLHYDRKVGLRWTWQSMDGAMTKAPLGGECTGPNPTDRAKRGVKRSLQIEAAGIPIGLVIAPANRNDCKLVRTTLESRPNLPPPETSQHICLDKGYDFPEVREIVQANGFVAHIRSRGEEARDMERNRKRKARRWVVERTRSWMNRFRRLLIRWERKVANYLALAQFACAWISYRAAGLFAAR
jgi:putative transposase